MNVATTTNQATYANLSVQTDRPRVLAIIDVSGWVFDQISQSLAQTLASQFHIEPYPATQLLTQSESAAKAHISKFDLVYCFSPIMPDQAYERLSVRPMVVGIHSVCSMDHQPELFVPSRFTQFKAIGCVNNLIANRCRSFGLHENITVTSNGVDTKRFTMPTNQPHRPTVRCGWCGTVNRREGPIKRFGELVVPACSQAGVPLIAATREYSCVPTELMPEYYRNVDVYVCASTSEGSQGPLVEAAASGCALLSTPVGIAEELIQHGQNGFLVDDTIDAIADKLYWFKEHPQETKQMGAAARNTVLQDWTWERRARHYADLFNTAISNH